MDINKADLEPTQDRHEDMAASVNEKGENTVYHIDPAIEKRVIRKIDRAVIPLVMGLCECSMSLRLLPQPLYSPLTIRFGLFPGPFKHWKCRDRRNVSIFQFSCFCGFLTVL